MCSIFNHLTLLFYFVVIYTLGDSQEPCMQLAIFVLLKM